MGIILKSIIIFLAIQCGYNKIHDTNSKTFNRNLNLCISDLKGFHYRNDYLYCSSLCNDQDCFSECNKELHAMYHKICSERLIDDLKKEEQVLTIYSV